MKIVLPLLAGMFVTGSVLADEYLKPEQIQNLFVGNKVIAQVGNGPMFDFQMNADKTATTSAAGGDTGKWRFSDDGYCVTWSRLRSGTERCFTVSKFGLSHFVIAPDGSRTRIVRIDQLATPAAQPSPPPTQSASEPTPAPPAAPAAPAAAQPSGPAPGSVASPAAVAAPASMAPAQQSQGAEQRLKQARDLLDKKLITQEQYDEFVSRIMKEM